MRPNVHGRRVILPDTRLRPVVLAFGLAALLGPGGALGQDMSKMLVSTISGKAAALMNSGEYSMALPYLQEIVRRGAHGNSADLVLQGLAELARYNIGIARLGLGENDTAITEFQNYLRDYPHGQFRKNCFLLIPEALIGQGKWDQAIEAIKTQLREVQLDADLLASAHALLAEAYFRLQKLAEALPELQYVYENAPRKNMRTRAAALLT